MVLDCDYCGRKYGVAARAVVDALDDGCCPECLATLAAEPDPADELDTRGWRAAAATVAEAVDELPF